MRLALCFVVAFASGYSVLCLSHKEKYGPVRRRRVCIYYGVFGGSKGLQEFGRRCLVMVAVLGRPVLGGGYRKLVRQGGLT